MTKIVGNALMVTCISAEIVSHICRNAPFCLLQKIQIYNIWIRAHMREAVPDHPSTCPGLTSNLPGSDSQPAQV